MRPDLHRRVTLALFAMAALAGGLVAVAAWTAHAWMEDTVLDAVLEREAATLLSQPALDGRTRTTPQGVSLYQAGISEGWIPLALRELPPGTHRDVRFDGQVFHVLVGSRADGRRYYLAYDVTRMAQREWWLLLGLCGALAVLALLSWYAGRRLAGRLLAPVASVVRRISTLDSEQLRELPTRDADAELTVVIDAINHLIREIEHRIARDRALAAAMSHELRTPLTAIRIAAEAMDTAEPVNHERVARVQRAVDTASATLDTLLAATRRNEPPRIERIALHTQLQAWAEPYMPHGDRPEVTWQLEPVEVDIDRAAFSIIFTNLLRNALRAAPDGRVCVRLRADALLVCDDGDGIDAELLPQVFEPGTHGRGGGSGIGLFLCRLLADARGWQLDVTNAAAGGVEARLQFRPHG
jgi:signal transduction histidine kinase